MATSFGGGDGVKFADFGGNESPPSMARDSNGRLYFAGGRAQSGEVPAAIEVFRLEASGAKSLAYGDGGVAVIEFGDDSVGLAIAIDGAHRAVVAGRVDVGDPADFAVVRLEA